MWEEDKETGEVKGNTNRRGGKVVEQRKKKRTVIVKKDRQR